MKKFLLSAIVCVFGYSAMAQTTFTLDSTVLEQTTVITGIDIPWEITWGPDDMIWTTERYGRVSRIDPVTGAQDVVLDISSTVYQASESGLLGLAFHPDFTNSSYVYLVYTYGSFSNIRERMVRYEYNGTSLVNPFTMIEDIVGNTTHIGSRLLVLPDNTIIMTTGDAQNPVWSQDITEMTGKVLRFNLDGTIPADNPFAGSPVYSWGHRNAQGLWLHNNILYCSEHGPSNDDELHIIMKGRNYGWPNVEGYCNTTSEMAFCADSNVVEPLAVWTPTIAPSDIIWYDNPAIPEWNNSLLMTVLKDKRLIRFKFNATGDMVTSEDDFLVNQFGRLRDICIGPDGSVYIATNGNSWSNTNPFSHSIIKLRPINPNSVEEVENEQEFHLMPNPASSHVVLAVTNGLLGETAQVYDVTGKSVLEVKLTEYNTTINCSALPAGTYYVRLSTAKGNWNETLIVR